MKYRTTVIALIKNHQDQYLICKTPPHRGVFPDQWGIPGGGIEPNETMTQALEREVWEEVGLKITNIQPFYFRDDIQPKIMPDGTQEDVYMIYLLFTCKAVTTDCHLNEEYVAAKWVSLAELDQYNLNQATRHTFGKLHS